MDTQPTFALSHQEFLQVDRDFEKAASTAHLVYVSDRKPGILRIKKGRGFSYVLNKKTVSDREQLDRIRKLVIPPAWTEVWISADKRGHIQATGLDIRGRKQYRYHPLWNSLRSETKFHRLYEFGKVLPILRGQLEEDLRKKGLTQAKVLATVVSLMERTFIRVGNFEYEKANGSYGLTTFKNKHVSISGDTMIFSFTGKKGIHHDVTLRNKRLARIVAQCQDIPGKELFEYYDEEGSRKAVDSGMVNAYIKEGTGGDFSAKIFRTWAGSLHALEAFRDMGKARGDEGEARGDEGKASRDGGKVRGDVGEARGDEGKTREEEGEALTATEIKRNINVVLDCVSGKLGNTRTVCRKYYVHPGLISLYEEGKLDRYLRELNKPETDGGDNAALTAEERVLMKILRQFIIS
jgi:DNA topoisomerase-1